jgi:hypothetical protein
MSLLSKTKTKINNVKNDLSPLSVLGVVSIEVEDGFEKVFDTIDPNKLMDINLTNSDLSIPISGNCDYTDLYRRLTCYVCNYYINNKDDFKLNYEDIVRNNKPIIPIVLLLSVTIKGNKWLNVVSVVLPNDKRLKINYKKYE